MVQLSLQPFRGSSVTTHFPYSGYLGLTPVVVQGKVVLHSEKEASIEATSLIVRLRCYESDLSHNSLLGKSKGKDKKIRVVYERPKTLWAKDPAQQYTVLNELVTPFRITLKSDFENVLSSTTLRTYRSWWQLEAVLFHKPSSVFGRCMTVVQQIPLTSYAPHTCLPAIPRWTGAQSIPNTIGTYFDHNITVPKASFGPGELVPFKIHLSGPPSNIISVKKIQFTLERRVSLKSLNVGPNLPKEDQDGFLLNLEEEMECLIPSASSTAESFIETGVSTIASVEVTDVGFDVDQVATLAIPRSRSFATYAVGETCDTELVSISFQLTARVYVKHRQGSEWVALSPTPVDITMCTDEERETAKKVGPRQLNKAEITLKANVVGGILALPQYQYSYRRPGKRRHKQKEPEKHLQPLKQSTSTSDDGVMRSMPNTSISTVYPSSSGEKELRFKSNLGYGHDIGGYGLRSRALDEFIEHVRSPDNYSSSDDNIIRPNPKAIKLDIPSTPPNEQFLLSSPKFPNFAPDSFSVLDPNSPVSVASTRFSSTSTVLSSTSTMVTSPVSPLSDEETKSRVFFTGMLRSRGDEKNGTTSDSGSTPRPKSIAVGSLFNRCVSDSEVNAGARASSKWRRVFNRKSKS